MKKRAEGKLISEILFNINIVTIILIILSFVVMIGLIIINIRLNSITGELLTRFPGLLLIRFVPRRPLFF